MAVEVKWTYEDELPEMSDDIFAVLFNQSQVIDGVRMYPVATLIPHESDFDVPECQCSDCDVIFGITWRRDGVTDRVEYCPFCGAEIEEKDA